jgi:hypothetical protein
MPDDDDDRTSGRADHVPGDAPEEHLSSYFVRSDGLDNTSASEFCDPAIDTHIARVDAMQATDPLAKKRRSFGAVDQTAVLVHGRTLSNSRSCQPPRSARRAALSLLSRAVRTARVRIRVRARLVSEFIAPASTRRRGPAPAEYGVSLDRNPRPTRVQTKTRLGRIDADASQRHIPPQDW